MLGPTGAGKSFFGNGLFGEKTPETGIVLFNLLFAMFIFLFIAQDKT